MFFFFSLVYTLNIWVESLCVVVVSDKAVRVQS